MKKNLTELVFIIDKSGSMAGLESDTVGGFNAMIAKQKKEQGDALVSTVLFSDRSLVLHDRVDIKELSPLTERQYTVGGCTALLDAVGYAVKHIASIHKYAREEDVPEHTLFVITTDGMENASKGFSYADVKALIERYEKEKGWEFMFVAANIDAPETAASMGIRRERAANYRYSPCGTQNMYMAMSDAVSNARSGADIGEAWKARLDGTDEE